MDNKYYLAVDIGASSGRHMLCHLEDHKMVLEEIYRFSNGMTEKNGHKVWDIRRLSDEIKEGMKRCAQLGKIPYSMGIDTWAVDYVLLDENDKVLGDAYAYRDVRTQAMDQEVYRYISEDELYQKTGIQKQIFNTIYQLMAVKVKAPEIMAKARDMLMIPDYFHFLLTGNKVQEYTNATTTQLVDPITKDWNREFIEKLGFPQEIFKEIKKPGYEVGELTAMTKQETNAVKQFLSKTDDIYRAAYGRRTNKYPRRCVFFGTSNEEEFLKDMTGNRRFWPVDVGVHPARKSVWNDLPDEVDQIWAEAVTAYRIGEPLYMQGKAEMLAKQAQESHQEMSEREGIIREFLSIDLPKDWSQRDLIQRRVFLNNDFGRPDDCEPRKYICAAEIWCECFEKDIAYLNKAGSREINDILSNIEGLEKMKTPHRFPIYGSQRGYILKSFEKS